MCEALEPRRLFAVITFETGTRTLTVTGTSGADDYVIDHDGLTRDITITGGDVDETRSNVRKLVINTGNGADNVRYNLRSTNRLDFDLEVDLGDGSDVFVGDLLGFNIGNASTLLVDVEGSSGSDNLVFLSQTPANRCKIFAGSMLEVRLDGSFDADSMSFNYGGELDGRLHFVEGGGEKNDNHYANVVIDAGSTGIVGDPDRYSVLFGFTESDRLECRITNNSGGDAHVFARIDGGSDIVYPIDLEFSHDTAIRTRNVSVRRVETDTVVTAFGDRTITRHPRVGQEATISGIVFQPNVGQSFFLDVDWGDGTTETIEFPDGTFVSDETRLEIGHIYAKKGKYDVELQWHDGTIVGNSDTLSVHVLPKKGRKK